MKRRDFLHGAVATGALLTLGATSPSSDLPQKITGSVKPIGAAEFKARIAKAQGLMRAQGIDALIVEPGSSLIYFTGIHWRRSERLTAAIIPAEGDVVGIVTPFFEEPSVRESLVLPAEVRTWQEDEDPLALVGGWLRDHKAGGTVAIEETVRYFAIDGLAKVLPGTKIVSGADVVRGCRMIKSSTEIALMQASTDVTLAAYRYTVPRIEKGMTPEDIGALMDKATIALGGTPEFSLVLLGEASAYPHGSGKPQAVREGEVVLMDCGCAVEGYQSDISRSFVFGGANARQRAVWDQVHRGQDIAFAAAKLGAPAGTVDDAARTYYESLGYGPRYALPGLPHRTGHGIGIDGHEPVNLVHGETTRLAPGMCFSNEPGLYVPGAFGIRIEDCFHMTESGPRWFSTPPASIDAPLG